MHRQNPRAFLFTYFYPQVKVELILIAAWNNTSHGWLLAMLGHVAMHLPGQTTAYGRPRFIHPWGLTVHF